MQGLVRTGLSGLRRVRPYVIEAVYCPFLLCWLFNVCRICRLQIIATPYGLREHLPARRYEALLQNAGDLPTPSQGLLFLQLTVRDALNSALDEEMVRDENVFIIGEEVRDDRVPAS